MSDFDYKNDFLVCYKDDLPASQIRGVMNVLLFLAYEAKCFNKNNIKDYIYTKLKELEIKVIGDFKIMPIYQEGILGEDDDYIMQFQIYDTITNVNHAFKFDFRHGYYQNRYFIFNSNFNCSK